MKDLSNYCKQKPTRKDSVSDSTQLPYLKKRIHIPCIFEIDYNISIELRQWIRNIKQSLIIFPIIMTQIAINNNTDKN